MSVTRFGISIEDPLLKGFDELIKRKGYSNLTDLQHHYHHSIISAMHIHLDAHNCLETIIVKGRARDIKTIADRLIGTKGVKHGKLTATTMGKHLK